MCCALALACAPAYAQSSAASSTSAPSASTTKPVAKSSTAKTSSKASTSKSATKSTKSSASHSSSHSSASGHTKSNSVSTAHRGKSTRASLRKKGKGKARGQQKIDSERAEAIQEALIREHYLSGEPAGVWNQSSEDAMRRYQADHGWQSKEVPDARALISLGLGPSHDHLLNPESAMTTGPAAPHAATLTPASHSAEPGGRMNTSPAPGADSVPTASSDRDATHPQ